MIPLFLPCFLSADLRPAFEQSVPVAKGIQFSHPVYLEARFRIPLGIQLHELDTDIRHRSQEGNVVILGHGVIHRDVVLVLQGLHMDPVLLILRFRIHRRQRDPAAGDQRLPSGSDHISAHRTHVELAPHHVEGPVPILHILARQQFDHRDVQCLRQRLQQTDIREALPGIT